MSKQKNKKKKEKSWKDQWSGSVGLEKSVQTPVVRREQESIRREVAGFYINPHVGKTYTWPEMEEITIRNLR